MHPAKEGLYVRCESTARAHREARPREEGKDLRRRLAIGAEVTGDSEPTICVDSAREASSLRVAAGAKVHEGVGGRHIALWSVLCKRRDCSKKDNYSQPRCLFHCQPPMKPCFCPVKSAHTSGGLTGLLPPALT